MIELPEATVIAEQISGELRGKRIESAMRGNAPHKFAFYNRPPEEYESLLRGRTIGDAKALGGHIIVAVEPDYALILGGGGERIFLHPDGSTLPKKHQLLLHFTDGCTLTVTVQMWGCAQLTPLSEAGDPCRPGEARVSPVSDEFTYDYFRGLFDQVAEEDPRSAKFFAISQPGIWGLGNGYLQDILFRARIHPRRRVVALGEEERRAFYRAIRATLQEAVRLRGRDTELDLHGAPGGYRPILDRRAKGLPCPNCATPIEAISYLGGTSYLCPRCQAS